MKEIVELRVHGVHGTSPAAMLGVDEGDVRQVAGDNLTGVYRSASGQLPYRDLSDQSDLPPDQPRVSVEGYSWGALTSGVRGVLGWLQRALWLLLLPFALANLAYWARLHLDGREAAARWGARFTRVGALLLTVFLVLIPAIIGIDLVAWQCYRGGSPTCTRLPGLLDFMADLAPGQRLAAGSLLPLAFVALLWFLSRQSLLRYEDVTYDEHEGANPTKLVLRHPRLWSGKRRTQQLQRLHLAVAIAVVVAFSGAHVIFGLHDHSASVVTTTSVAAVLAALAGLSLFAIHPDDIERVGLREVPLFQHRMVGARAEAWLREQVSKWLLVAMVLAALAHLVVLCRLSPALPQRPDLFGHNLWFIGVFIALTAVHIAVFTGDRMGRVGAILSVTVVLLLAGGAVWAQLHPVSNGVPPRRQQGQSRTDALLSVEDPFDVRWFLLAGILLVYLVLAVWHGVECLRFRRAAWNGAGASVLLASAGWVALLFTTGAVTATANWLNGPEHGVDALVSTLGDTPSGAIREAARANVVTADYEDGRLLGARTTFELSGDVVVRDAVILFRGGRPVLVSGTVEADQVFVAAGRRTDPGEDAVAKGRVRIASGRLLLGSDSVRLEDSCVRSAWLGEECLTDRAEFLPGSRLKLPSEYLQVVGGVSAVDGPDPVLLDPRDPPAVPLVVPQVLIWSPLAQTAWLVLAVLWVALALLAFRRSRAAIDRLVVVDGIAPRDQDAARKARRTAAFAHRAERLIDGIGSITAVLIIALIAVSSTGDPPADFFPRWVPNVGMYVALGMGLGLVLLLSRLRRSEDTRKALGVLWDLTTFWPRAAHPLAPPCYAERVVPELRTRIDWALHHRVDGQDLRADNVVILSGHSQGSAIACAVLSRLPREDLARVRLITYGSQIRALYGRIFPAVFGPDQIGYVPTLGPTELGTAFPDAPSDRFVTETVRVPKRRTGSHRVVGEPLLQRLCSAGGSWVNLFRRSDPLGYRVFSDRDAEPDRYVPELPDVVVGDPGPSVMTHGGYQHTHAYRAAVAEWTHEEVLGEPVSTVDLPTVATS